MGLNHLILYCIYLNMNHHKNSGNNAGTDTRFQELCKHKVSKETFPCFAIACVKLTSYLCAFKRFSQLCHTSSGWWFQTFFIFHNIWDNPSQWLICFKMVKTTNQSCLYKAVVSARDLPRLVDISDFFPWTLSVRDCIEIIRDNPW